MKTYKLYNRYRDKISLIDLGDNKLQLEGGEYIRILSNDNGKTLEAIDPSGGPFMSAGGSVSVYDPNDEHYIKDFSIISIMRDEKKNFILHIK